MRFLTQCIKLSIFLLFLIALLGFNSQVYSAPVCSGSFTCNKILNVCNPENCIQGVDDPCTCSNFCAPGTDGPWQCGGNICPAQQGLCSELCGIASYDCSLISDPCTVGSQCGANSRCCAGFLCGKAVSEVGVMVLSFKEYTLINI